MKIRLYTLMILLMLSIVFNVTKILYAMGKNGSETTTKNATIPQVKVGELIPNIELKDLEGNTVRLSDYSGNIIVLEFWATWCPDCREVLPHLQTLSETSEDTGFSLITVSVDTDPETVRAFMNKNGYSFPVLYGGVKVRELFAVKAIPTLYLIDRKGVIQESYVEYGSRGIQKVDQRIRQLIDEH